ncbi:tryptophan-rich sensory protein [Nodosilinea sp. LEGE 07088]|uniref:tryptophan-rich sensory protein n=1 Tax=Nodosilinea sp. LEGE 07088 TaxID=2777968 RepID=UPI00187F2A38|nr:tryptophan-rich sensory protein [Nodosilinea sp. LEGE 07088]MBE9138719.1 tryptophan-rich sensory protein [Nodosilinea sp. LEGE 07088]
MDNSRNRAQSGLGLAVATAIAIVGSVVFNTLFNRFPPGGQNVGEIANTVLAGVLITPANYAFAIWGLIYLGLFAYGIYQFHPQRRQDGQLQRVNQLVIGACVVQSIWIWLFSLQQFAWSVVAMAGLLALLIGIYLTLNIGRNGRQSIANNRVSRRRRWMADIPFSLYLGWIAVATIVNVASALYAANWAGWGLSPVAWTVIMIVVAALLGEVVVYQRGDTAFILVFVWALVAIAVRQSDISIIRLVSLTVAGVLVAWLIWVNVGWPRRS